MSLPPKKNFDIFNFATGSKRKAEEEEGLGPPAPAKKLQIAAPVPTVPKPLLALSIPLATVREFLSKMTSDVSAAASAKQKNQNLTPVLRSLADTDLKFPQGLDHGHCRALWVRKAGIGGKVVESLKLKEGGGNNDSPRVVCPGLDGKKIYLYHLVVVDEASRSPSPRLSLDLLAGVSQQKAELCAKTILHLCGHKWCTEPSHFAVGSKMLNDEQTSCHRILQSAETQEEYETIQRVACRHMPKCWTVLYSGEFADQVGWALE
jgi:homing endonuclease-like protein